jgi:hypothetical protein
MEKFIKILKGSFVVLYVIVAVRAIIEAIAEGDLPRTIAMVGIGTMILVIICIAEIMGADEDKRVKEKLESED